jgi:hypothetical protein
MSSIIFCPHTDDAIFSLGDYIIDNNNDYIIASAFAGVPTDDAGYKKHTILRKEHKDACSILGAKIINGDLLDDVYGKQDEELLVNWINETIKDCSSVYVPLGIHHPDHVFLSDTMFNLMNNFNKNYFVYAELPYRILYPELYNERLNKFKSKYELNKININFTKRKFDAINKYESQIKNNLIEKLLVEENLWAIKK